MQKTMMYLPPHLKDKIKRAAQDEGTSQAEVIRTALEAGLETVSSQKNASAKSLIKLAELGKKHQTKKLPKTNALSEIDKMWQGWGNKDE